MHSEFEQAVKDLNNPLLKTEVSYKNGIVVPRGTAGSVRLDVVEYNPNGTVKAIFDLKTGKAGLTQTRINQILSHVGENVPVVGIRP